MMSSVAVVIRERGGSHILVASLYLWHRFLKQSDRCEEGLNESQILTNPYPHSASTPSEHEVKLMFLLYYLESHGGRLKINFHSSSNRKLMDIFSDTVLK